MSLVSHEQAGEQLCMEAVGQLLEAGARVDAALRPAVQLLQDRFPRRWVGVRSKQDSSSCPAILT